MENKTLATLAGKPCNASTGEKRRYAADSRDRVSGSIQGNKFTKSNDLGRFVDGVTVPAGAGGGYGGKS